MTADRVFTGLHDIGPARIVSEDGGIVAIEPLAGAAEHAMAIPGLIDLQVNGYRDVDVSDADHGALDRLDAMLRGAGTTTWCPTIITRPLDTYQGLLVHLDGWDRPSSVPGFHLEGPFLGGAPGAHDPRSITAVDMDWVRELPSSVRVMTIAPEADGALAAATWLEHRGVVVSMGHTAASTPQCQAFVRAGARMATHCFNGMGQLHHRDPGPVGVALTEPRLTTAVIADLVHVHPMALQLVVTAKGPNAVLLVSDSIGWEAPALRDRGVRVSDGAPRLADGTLAGTCISLLDAVRNMVNIGADPAEVVAMATSTPAQLLGLTDRGHLAAGRRADIVCLSPEWEIDAVHGLADRPKSAARVDSYLDGRAPT